MKNFIIFFFMLSVVFLVAGCKTMHSALHTASHQNDTTVVHITERYTPVSSPADTLEYSLQLRCPEYDQVQRTDTVYYPLPVKAEVSGRHSHARVKIDKIGRLRMIFNCDAWRDSVLVRDTLIAHLRHQVRRDSVVVTLHERYVPGIYKASMWMSGIVILLIIGAALYAAARMYLKSNLL